MQKLERSLAGEPFNIRSAKKRGQIFSNYNLLSPTDSTLLPKIKVVDLKFYLKSVIKRSKIQNTFIPPEYDPNLHFYVVSKKLSQNKKAKLTYGNRLAPKRKGLINMHLNMHF